MKRSRIKRIFKNLTEEKKESQKNTKPTNNKKVFSTDLNKNEKILQDRLGSSQDVIFTNFMIELHNEDQINAMMVAIDGLVDEDAKRDNIIQPLMEPPIDKNSTGDLDSVKERISAKSITIEGSVDKAIQEILKSHAFILVEGFSKGLLISIEGYEIRDITEPESEMVVRGPREGFIESLSVNLSLIRRKIAHPSLRFDTIQIGEYSQTDVVIAYVKDIVDHKLIERIKNKLHQIKIDSIKNTGTIEQLIEEHPYSPFPTIGNTERPDVAISSLMEGRIVILVDGNPVTLVAPFQFAENIKNIEDYTSRPYYASLVRFIRFFAFGFSIILPALYISAINFNKALIPSEMIVPLTVARETVPFTLALETAIMFIVFEIIREAGVRLPKQVGTAVSIVGPIVLGEVAVNAALVGAPTVIIVSMSYIAAFVISSLTDAITLLRIFLFAAAAIFGSYGLIVALLTLFTHMATLTSFGVPYMAPFSPLFFRDWKDAFIRFPLRLLRDRPKSIPNHRPRKIHSVPDMEKKP